MCLVCSERRQADNHYCYSIKLHLLLKYQVSKMRLTAFLAFGKKPYGFKYRGKNRVVKDIKPHELRNLREDYERTEENMLWLRHPYLTVEQSRGHMSHVNRAKMFLDEIARLRNEKFEKHVTLAERLVHLKVTEKWD